jgi:hypothetical protein
MKSSYAIFAVALIAASGGPANAATAPFGCDARAPSVCHFRIFYTPRGNRNVILPSGMKQKIPELQIGRDSYCLSVGRPPVHKCARKPINATYND